MEIREIANAKFNLPSESERNKAKATIEKMRKDGEKLVKGMFEFIDAQGGWFDFSYRFFPGDPVRCVRIIHGEITEMPMVLVKHLNNIWRKVRTMDPNPGDEKGGKPKFATVERYSRTRFTPMDVL